MSEIKAFAPVKLVYGIIFSEEPYFRKAQAHLIELHGRMDLESPSFDFDLTDYYKKQMGQDLQRRFMTFQELIRPEELSEIKVRANHLEEDIKKECREERRIVNIDPGYITSSALIMATAKDFSHRIPLQQGIYAHLEFLFGKTGIRTLDWTYPDLRREVCQKFFLEARRVYLAQLKILSRGS